MNKNKGVCVQFVGGERRGVERRGEERWDGERRGRGGGEEGE